MFNKARTGSENVQEQKRKGDRDPQLRMFQKDRTGSGNVQEQKQKGDTHI